MRRSKVSESVQMVVVVVEMFPVNTGQSVSFSPLDDDDDDEDDTMYIIILINIIISKKDL